MTVKKCLRCKKVKPLDKFYRHKGSKDGRQPRCAECSKEQIKEYSRANPEGNRARAKKWNKANPHRRMEIRRKSKFGLSPEAHDALLDSQGGLCAICRSPPVGKCLAVDHDHETGKVRGLLCAACNQGLGMFKDRVDLMESAVIYLLKTSGEV